METARRLHPVLRGPITLWAWEAGNEIVYQLVPRGLQAADPEAHTVKMYETCYVGEYTKRHLQEQRVALWPRLVRWAKRVWTRDVAGEGY
jgi:hypothetical protein